MGRVSWYWRFERIGMSDGLSSDTRKIAISCLLKEAMTESYDVEPLYCERFLHFLVEALPRDDLMVNNLSLKLLSTGFSESSKARAYLRAGCLTHTEFARNIALAGLRSDRTFWPVM
jgi:hypothetical protein